MTAQPIATPDAGRRFAHCRHADQSGRRYHHGIARFSQSGRRYFPGCVRSEIGGRRFRIAVDLSGERSAEWDAESLAELTADVYTREAQEWARRELARREGYRGTGMSRAALLAMWRESVELQYLAAESACNGQLVNAAARAAGVSARSLFTGPARRAAAYTTEELLWFWQDNSPRLTFEAWLGNQDSRNSAAVSF